MSSIAPEFAIELLSALPQTMVPRGTLVSPAEALVDASCTMIGGNLLGRSHRDAVLGERSTE
jgi:hypothetical protein